MENINNIQQKYSIALINDAIIKRHDKVHIHVESDITNLTTDLNNKVTANSAITPATKTKITYDAKGLVTAGGDVTTADVADSMDKRYCTDAQKTVIGNTSGTNTGDITAYSSVSAKTTPGAVGTAGSSANWSKGDHTHQSPGGLVTNTSQISITNTNAETTILTIDVPADLLTVGSQFRFNLRGTHQSQATSGILTIRMYVGANAGQTVVMATQTNAVAASSMRFDGFATVRTIGAGGTFITGGIYEIINGATTRINYGQGGASTTAVNTTATVPVKITAQWATSSSTNSLLIQNATIEIVKM